MEYVSGPRRTFTREQLEEKARAAAKASWESLWSGLKEQHPMGTINPEFLEKFREDLRRASEASAAPPCAPDPFCRCRFPQWHWERPPARADSYRPPMRKVCQACGGGPREFYKEGGR